MENNDMISLADILEYDITESMENLEQYIDLLLKRIVVWKRIYGNAHPLGGETVEDCGVVRDFWDLAENELYPIEWTWER